MPALFERTAQETPGGHEPRAVAPEIVTPDIPPQIAGRFRLRAVRDADAEAIIALIAGVWSEYPGKILDPARDMPELLAPATHYAEAGSLFWLLEDDRTIVGTIA